MFRRLIILAARRAFRRSAKSAPVAGAGLFGGGQQRSQRQAAKPKRKSLFDMLFGGGQDDQQQPPPPRRGGGEAQEGGAAGAAEADGREGADGDAARGVRRLAGGRSRHGARPASTPTIPTSSSSTRASARPALCGRTFSTGTRPRPTRSAKNSFDIAVMIIGINDRQTIKLGRQVAQGADAGVERRLQGARRDVRRRPSAAPTSR